MLSRLYLDNYRCFEKFEHRPGRKELLLGGNGSGKSSLIDAVLLLRQVVNGGAQLDSFQILAQRTRWANLAPLNFELDARLDDADYTYSLTIEPWGHPERARIAKEVVLRDGMPIFEFEAGEVRLFNDRLEHKVTYEFDWHRSALATIVPRHDNQLLTRFREWLTSVFAFRINPFAIVSRADGEDLWPNVNLSNLASWYRNLVQSHPAENSALLKSLKSAMDGFGVLKLDSAGENVRLMAAEFDNGSKFYLNELSDGQRCLIGLYVILHFVLARGGTVLLDEPDNFISLREIQPWLSAVSDVLDDGVGQILIASHNPEVINQWAPDHGVEMTRAGNGPVQVARFHRDGDAVLSPSELIARGW